MMSTLGYGYAPSICCTAVMLRSVYSCKTERIEDIRELGAINLHGNVGWVAYKMRQRGE